MLDVFTRQYLTTALWSSLDSEGRPLDDNHSTDDLDVDTLEEMVEDCRRFQEENWDKIKDNLELAGHDFWLTRNGHGAGFWDGDWPDQVGEELSVAAEKFGEYDLYVEDGNIYH
jgi:hypothetical protein